MVRLFSFFSKKRKEPSVSQELKISELKIDIQNKGYETRGPEFSGWDYLADSADNDILDNLQELRGMSRDLYMTNEIAVAVLEKFRNKGIGVGLLPEPTINYSYLGISEEKAKEMERIIKMRFDAWAYSTNSDTTRMHDFYTLQSLAMISWLMNGDVFAVVKRKKTSIVDIELCIQLIEADRVVNPLGANELTKEGVEFNSNGELFKYYISNKHPGDGNVEIQGYPVFNSLGGRHILHIFEPNRIGQRRGVPILAPVLKSFKQLGRYKDAELMAAVLSATVAMILKTQTPGQGGIINKGHLNDALGRAESGNNKTDVEEIRKQVKRAYRHGTVFETTGEDELKEFQTTRPNKNFSEFVNHVLEEIGASLGMPHEVMMGSFKSSYSAVKAALEEAETRIANASEIIKRKFCQLVYEEFLIELLRNGEIECPGFFENINIRRALSRCIWIGRHKPSLDPVKDARADEYNLKNGLTTKRYIVRSKGQDYDELQNQRRREAIEQAELDMEVMKIKKGVNNKNAD